MVAKELGELGPIYGAQWRNWKQWHVKNYVGGNIQIDQIQNLINDLKTNPDSRRLMVNSWNVGELDQMVLPPCHYGFQVYTRELSPKERIELAGGKIQEKYPALIEQSLKVCDEREIPTRAISLMWSQRSVDVPLGLPFNIASYALLLQILGELTNMVPEELIGNLGDCHIYNNQIDSVKEQLTRKSHALPMLTINTEFWPTESGECGVGYLHNDVSFLIKNMRIEDFQLVGYTSEPKIFFPLSN